MSLTDQQTAAINAWNRGDNVRIVAVPGAGKSRVLIEACREATGLTIILAYNRDLCQETKQRIAELKMDDWVICMTFHGLATYCVQPTYDDIALADVIDFLEAGGSHKKLQNVSNVLIDECQDFRPSFLVLIKHLINTDNETHYMAVGDSRQMLYDYNEDDPASLEYLQDPATYFRSKWQWTSVVFDVTHRLTPPMARLVGSMYSVDLHSSKPEGASPVEVQTINLWRSGAAIYDLLRGADLNECAILVARKKNNTPLRAAVNFLSKKGIRLYIHGMDGQDPRIKRNKLCISTWHASKGTQRKICIVWGLCTAASDDDRINAEFVAMTRSQERLIVLQDDKAPSKRLLHALVNARPQDVQIDNATRKLVNTIDSIPDPKPWTPDRRLVCVDGWRPSGSGRWMCSMMDVTQGANDSQIHTDAEDIVDEEDEIIAGLLGDHEDVADVYRLACLIASEHAHSGTIRRVSDIFSPLRLNREHHGRAVEDGTHARFISPTVPDDALLSTEHRATVKVIDAKSNRTTADWCYLACVSRAWNGYHHMLRQLHPFDWMDEDKFHFGVDVVLQALQGLQNIIFDARVYANVDGQTVHARCDALADESAFIFTWKPAIAHSDRMEAAIVAALHPRHSCSIVNIRTGETVGVNVQRSVESLRRRLIS